MDATLTEPSDALDFLTGFTRGNPIAASQLAVLTMHIYRLEVVAEAVRTYLAAKGEPVLVAAHELVGAVAALDAS